MNYIFYFLIVVSIIAGAINGKLPDVVNGILMGADLSVKVALSLIGIMAFWLGIMRIAEKAGIVSVIAKCIKPIAKWLFDDLPTNSPAIGNVALSFSANALGLTNAATPIGLKVMQEMQEENKDKSSASDSMCMFLAMSTAGFQLIPATVIAILVGAGASHPTEIIAPTIIVTSIAFLSSIIIAKILKRLWISQQVNVEEKTNA